MRKLPRRFWESEPGSSTTAPAEVLGNHWYIPLMYVDFRIFSERDIQWGEAICSQRAHFPFYLHLLNVLSEINFSASWNALWFLCLTLVPITSALKVEWPVSTTSFWVEPQNQLYLLNFRLAVWIQPQGLKVERMQGRLLTQPDVSSLAIEGHGAFLSLHRREITFCGLDESRDFSHL